METYQVANVEEAVELANRLKDEGTYNWFRGQVSDWKPVSSLFRIQESFDAAQEDAVQERIQLFGRWLEKTPGLEYLLRPERVNDACAIMQHYGIPTHYIDFTTDPSVAGYFAADCTTPPTQGSACIYCLNTEDLLSLWNILKSLDERKGAEMEFIAIDVSNLWRLQAQHGVFLYCNYQWSMDYPMDRILFPYSGYPSFPTRERIYPENQSPLEQLLLQYFDLERRVEHEKWMKQQGHPYTRWKVFPKGYNEKAFCNGIDELASWADERLEDWLITVDEDYHQAIGPNLSLRIPDNAGGANLGKAISFGIKQALRSDPKLRLRTVNWQLAGNTSLLKLDEVQLALRQAWNGTRRLPYSDGEIADCIGMAAALTAGGMGDAISRNDEKAVFESCFGESRQVEFGTVDGTGSKGCVESAALRDALRPDLEPLLTTDFKSSVNDLQHLFMILYNPRRMFDFEKFKALFVRQVVPCQVALKRSPVLFNPVRLISFGNP